MGLGKLACLAAAVAAFPVIASIATSCLVASRAAEVAGSSPYCIEVADEGSDYKPARSLLDLSAWRMRAKREAGLSMQHHAILVVGAETKAVSLVVSAPGIRCRCYQRNAGRARARDHVFAEV